MTDYGIYTDFIAAHRRAIGEFRKLADVGAELWMVDQLDVDVIHSDAFHARMAKLRDELHGYADELEVTHAELIESAREQTGGDA